MQCVLYCANVRVQDVGCSRSSATVSGRAGGCPDNSDREVHEKLLIGFHFQANTSFVTKIS